CVRSDSNLDFW
nr:immunoglobulin heavy chain junction region [Macaca mulatta]